MEGGGSIPTFNGIGLVETHLLSRIPEGKNKPDKSHKTVEISETGKAALRESDQSKINLSIRAKFLKDSPEHIRELINLVDDVQFRDNTIGLRQNKTREHSHAIQEDFIPGGDAITAKQIPNFKRNRAAIVTAPGEQPLMRVIGSPINYLFNPNASDQEVKEGIKALAKCICNNIGHPNEFIEVLKYIDSLFIAVKDQVAQITQALIVNLEELNPEAAAILVKRLLDLEINKASDLFFLREDLPAFLLFNRFMLEELNKMGFTTELHSLVQQFTKDFKTDIDRHSISEKDQKEVEKMVKKALNLIEEKLLKDAPLHLRLFMKKLKISLNKKFGEEEGHKALTNLVFFRGINPIFAAMAGKSQLTSLKAMQNAVIISQVLLQLVNFNAFIPEHRYAFLNNFLANSSTQAKRDNIINNLAK